MADSESPAAANSFRLPGRFTLPFGDAQPVFYTLEKIQPAEERATFVFVTRIECQLFNSLSNCFLCLLYLFTQLLTIKSRIAEASGSCHCRYFRSIAYFQGCHHDLRRGKPIPRRADASGSLLLSPPQGCARGPFDSSNVIPYALAR